MVDSCDPFSLTTKVEMHHESFLEAFPVDNAAFDVNNVTFMDCGCVVSKSENGPEKKVNIKIADKMDPIITKVIEENGAYGIIFLLNFMVEFYYWSDELNYPFCKDLLCIILAWMLVEVYSN